MSWSDPIEGEVRDDQGICFKNPDTDLFMRYKLAGAYDSNIALLVTVGEDRLDSYRNLREALRCTVLRGPDLQTNLQFHYGLVNWFLANGVDAKPTTQFVVPYLTLVGELKNEANEIDAEYAYDRLCSRYLKAAEGDAAATKATEELCVLKQTLLRRPIGRILRQPHLLSAWLSANKANFSVEDGRIRWLRNPLLILADTYHLLHMNAEVELPAAHKIWDQDDQLLKDGAAFYSEVEQRLGVERWPDLDERLKSQKAPEGFDAESWQGVREAHLGFQLGLELYGLLPLIGHRVGFFDLRVNEDLTITIPERLFDRDHQTKMKKVLVPPPVNKADEIVAVSGGMFYAQEAPGMPRFLEEGQHFDIGDPLYIVEVMKMFNKVYAPFAGTVDKVLIETDGTIVSKGQPLYKVTPDEKFVEEDPAEVEARIRSNTDQYLTTVA
jgi:biotin carboxyl carrier protein